MVASQLLDMGFDQMSLVPKTHSEDQQSTRKWPQIHDLLAPVLTFRNLPAFGANAIVSTMCSTVAGTRYQSYRLVIFTTCARADVKFTEGHDDDCRGISLRSTEDLSRRWQTPIRSTGFLRITTFRKQQHFAMIDGSDEFQEGWQS